LSLSFIRENSRSIFQEGVAFTPQTLYSGIFAMGFSALTVSRLAAASLKWSIMKTAPSGDLSVTCALATTFLCLAVLVTSDQPIGFPPLITRHRSLNY